MSGTIGKVIQTTTTVLSTIEGCDITATATTTTISSPVGHDTLIPDPTLIDNHWPPIPTTIDTAFGSIFDSQIINGKLYLPFFLVTK